MSRSGPLPCTITGVRSARSATGRGEPGGLLYGHIGYHIDPDYRGHRYAGRACRLLRQEILSSGKSTVVITCDPDNMPSRKTCRNLGCLLEGICAVPEQMQKDFDLSARKCRYIWRIKDETGTHENGDQQYRDLV